MAREPQSSTIDGHLYTVTPLPTSPGWRLFRHFVGMVGPSAGVILDKVDVGMIKDLIGSDLSEAAEKAAAAVEVQKEKEKDEEGESRETNFIGRAIEKLLTYSDEAKCEHMIDALRSSTMVKPKGTDAILPLAEVFELHFQGDMVGLAKWLAFALRIQLGLFSGGSAKGADSPSPSQ